MRKVAVVVPVYNAGELLDRFAPSLLEQSLSPDEYEVVYVDDGSTDDSADRLAALAARYPHARYVRQENSGWPGKPRNTGVQLADAEYVQFVDQDDELGHEALERLYAAAVRHRADVVLGKTAGAMTGPNPVFRRSVGGASLAEIPAAESLTGHKLFRRGFLLEHGIAFPEGYWRMEDLLFVVQAYARLPRLAVVADYPCYLWHAREDGGNNSVRPFEVAGHYDRLRTIIATARDEMPDGEARDRLLRRLYRIEVLSRVMERYINDPTRTDWREAFPHLSAVARDCFPPHIRAGLPAVTALRGRLVEASEQQAAYELAGRIAGLLPQITRRGLSAGPDGVLRMDISFRLTHPDRDPVRLAPREAGWQLDPRLTAGLPGGPAEVPDPLRDAEAELQLVETTSLVWWHPGAELAPRLELTPDGEAEVLATGSVAIDPARAADGHPLPEGRYEVWFGGQLLGVSRRRRLVVPAPVRQVKPGWFVHTQPIATRWTWSEPGWRLQLEVRDRQALLAERLDPTTAERSADPSTLRCRLDAGLPAAGVGVLLSVADRPLNARLRPGAAPGTVELTLPAESALPDGRHPALVAGAFRFLPDVEVRAGRTRWTKPLTGPGPNLPHGVLRSALRRLRRP